jgi:cob(I)alamin adenosyltransferase
MAKIYTRTGDTGDTGLIGGSRARKDCLRVAAYGDMDELNAALGLARAELSQVAPAGEPIDHILVRLQHQLFNLGAELATPSTSETASFEVETADVASLENDIDHWSEVLKPLTEFVLPGGSKSAAAIHLARCICRRAERKIVALAAVEPVRPDLLRYVNRLSDLLFVLARAANHVSGAADVTWQKS